jgi:hypothetical protein
MKGDDLRASILVGLLLALSGCATTTPYTNAPWVPDPGYPVGYPQTMPTPPRPAPNRP